MKTYTRIVLNLEGEKAIELDRLVREKGFKNIQDYLRFVIALDIKQGKLSLAGGLKDVKDVV